jgi:hypothetical protein
MFYTSCSIFQWKKYSGNLPHSLPTACTGKRTLPHIFLFFLIPPPSKKFFESGVSQKRTPHVRRRQNRLRTWLLKAGTRRTKQRRAPNGYGQA